MVMGWTAALSPAHPRTLPLTSLTSIPDSWDGRRIPAPRALLLRRFRDGDHRLGPALRPASHGGLLGAFPAWWRGGVAGRVRALRAVPGGSPDEEEPQDGRRARHALRWPDLSAAGDPHQGGSAQTPRPQASRRQAPPLRFRVVKPDDRAGTHAALACRGGLSRRRDPAGERQARD